MNGSKTRTALFSVPYVCFSLLSMPTVNAWNWLKQTNKQTNKSDFRMTLKNGFVSVRYSFYQPVDEKNKTWPLRFPAKEDPDLEKGLFDWPIMLRYDIKAKYRLISRKFSGMNFSLPGRSLNQTTATCVCIRSLNQSNRTISVRSLFLFSSRFFISRTYEIRFKGSAILTKTASTGIKYIY